MFLREKKLKVIQVKVSDKEKDIIHELAKADNKNMSEFILSLINQKYMESDFRSIC